MDSITPAQRQAAAGAVVITAPGIGYITMFAGNRLPMCYVGDAWVIDTRRRIEPERRSRPRKASQAH